VKTRVIIVAVLAESACCFDYRCCRGSIVTARRP